MSIYEYIRKVQEDINILDYKIKINVDENNFNPFQSIKSKTYVWIENENNNT